MPSGTRNVRLPATVPALAAALLAALSPLPLHPPRSRRPSSCPGTTETLCAS
jgi:hypothetical protein